MDKGSDSLTKFSVLDNKTSSNSDFLSSMKLHQTTVTEPFVRSGDGGGGGGGVVGPTYSSGGANEAAAGYMYRDDISPSDRRGAESFGRNTPILQPFDNFHASYSTSTSPYKYSVGGMAMGFPFTAAQWKELERQAMIYKCMISSVPVPPNLLFPPDFSVDSSLPMYGGRYCRKGDLEPGRCKRTDGKKWRCSREVAPQQKYCERHLHRGRPRSRKPVEANKSINGENQKKPSHTKTLPTANDLKAKTDLTISTPYYKECNRDSCLMTGGGAASSKQPWENIGLSDYSSPSFDQDYAAAQPLNLFCYPNLPAPEMDLPTGFIDAWSIDHRSKGSVESSISMSEGDLSPSLNLSMAMAVGTAFDDQIRNIHADHVTWGPLGEALQPGSGAVGGSNPASPYNSISTAATTVSSPSGVLHWTLFSHSDGSVCNSPTFAAAEISNQWHI